LKSTIKPVTYAQQLKADIHMHTNHIKITGNRPANSTDGLGKMISHLLHAKY